MDRDLTVERMMRHDVKTVPADMTFAEFRGLFPPESTAQVVAVDHEGRYAGLRDRLGSALVAILR